jgi:plasmid stability protein
MATLVVRRLDEDLVQRLKARAMAHQRSAEAEHRAILEEALRPARTGADLWKALRGRGPWLDEGWDQRLRELDQPAEVPDLSQ